MKIFNYVFFCSSIILCSNMPHALAKGNSKQDIIELKQKASTGEVVAQRLLGFAYLIGDCVPENNTKAAKWLIKASDQGDREAQLNLGIMYAEGEGVLKEDHKALDCFRKATVQGD